MFLSYSKKRLQVRSHMPYLLTVTCAMISLFRKVDEFCSLMS